LRSVGWVEGSLFGKAMEAVTGKNESGIGALKFSGKFALLFQVKKNIIILLSL